MINTKKLNDFDEKKFYERYSGKITCAYKKDIFIDKGGYTRCKAKRTEEREKYILNELTNDVVLVECPKDILTIEFETHNNKNKNSPDYKEVKKEKLKEWIKQTYENAKDHNINCCIVSHGGTSDYIYACNIKSLIENKEKECKTEIAKLIVPKEAIDFIDLSNLGKTLIPIINRPHWKEKKYKGAIHKIIEGKNPDKQKNKVPEIVLQRVFNNEKPNFKKIDYGESDINSISITKVISTTCLKKKGGEYQGSNVWHGSSTGLNFCVNPSKNVFHCFRCNAGGGVAKAIGLNKGIIKDCSEDLSPSQFKDVLRIAREEYDLKKPETEKEDNLPKKPIPTKSDKKEILLPHPGKLISEFVLENSDIFKEKELIFFRPDFRDIVEIGKIKLHKNGEEKYTGFISVNPNRYITLIEEFIDPGFEEWNPKWKGMIFKKKSMSINLSVVVLASHNFRQSLPQIERIFNVPIPIIYNNKLTFPKKGYDIRFGSWLPNKAPKIIKLDMKLKEAKDIIYNMLKEFCFKSRQDYINAIAGILTPFLKGLFSKFNTRIPMPFYISNRERAGKDYLAGITGIIYEGCALEEPAISSDEKYGGNGSEELRKKITGAMIKGRKRLHFSNNKGYINNPVLEGLITSEKYSDRPLGKSDILEFDNEMDFSLSGNIGIRWTADLGNRSRFINLFLAMEDANKRKFENPDLHNWVLKNRGVILSALYSFVKNWFDEGMIPGKIPFASFPEWAKICGGIMEAAGYDSPCFTDKTTLSLSGDIETDDMKKLFEFGYKNYKDFWIKKEEIKSFIIQSGGDFFNDFDFNLNKSDQIKFGNLINKFVGRELSGITLICKNMSIRGQRQEFQFTKKSPENDKKTIFYKNENVDVYNQNGEKCRHITTLDDDFPRKTEVGGNGGNGETSFESGGKTFRGKGVETSPTYPTLPIAFKPEKISSKLNVNIKEQNTPILK